MPATEPADLALDAALLVCPVDAGHAKEAVEAVVRSQRNEPFRLVPVTALEDLHDRSLQIVVADPARHTTEVRERADVTVQEHLLCLVQIRPTEPAARRRETHHEQRHLAQHPGEIHADRAEVDLGFRAQRMRLRDRHLRQRQLLARRELDLQVRRGPLG